MFVGDAEPGAHCRRIIGDEDVGFRGELVQHRLSLRLREIKREALLVARFQHPRKVMFAVRIAGQMRQVAVGITRSRRLDLDDVGAEIRQHRGGRGRRDKTRAVQYLEAFKNAFFFHVGIAPVTQVGLFARRSYSAWVPFEPGWTADATCFHVIASEAKQSRIMGGTLDCFVASLLATTLRFTPRPPSARRCRRRRRCSPSPSARSRTAPDNADRRPWGPYLKGHGRRTVARRPRRRSCCG